MGINMTFPPHVTRDFSYRHKRGWWVAATREEWLQAILDGIQSPKPPPSWVKQEELEGRSPKTSAIIWARNYKPDRKFVIWSEASDDDFRAAGYR